MIEVDPHQDIDLLFAVYQIPKLRWRLSFYADLGHALVVTRQSPAADQLLAELSVSE